MRVTSIEPSLKVEGEFRRQRSRRDEVRSAKGGEEVVKRRLVRHVHARHLETPLEAIATEEIVVSNRSVKEIPLLNAGRIFIVVAGARRRNPEPRGAILRRWAWRRQGSGRRGHDSSAGETRFKLLVGGQAAEVDRRLPVERSRCAGARAVRIVGERVVAGRRSGDESAVVSPVEANPGAPVERHLILHMRGLIEPFIMVDPEW